MHKTPFLVKSKDVKKMTSQVLKFDQSDSFLFSFDATKKRNEQFFEKIQMNDLKSFEHKVAARFHCLTIKETSYLAILLLTLPNWMILFPTSNEIVPQGN